MKKNNDQHNEPEKKDTKASSEKPSKPQANAEAKTQPKRGSKLAALALLVSIVVGGGLAYKIHLNSQQYQTQINELQQKLQQNQNQLDSQLSTVTTKTQQQITNLNHATDVALAQKQKSIKSLQMALSDMKGRRPSDWMLAEANYLVKLAGRKLYMEHDISSAIALMEDADQRIAALNDPNLFPLRKAMAEDITKLKSLPIVDQDGLVLRLMALQKQITQLPLANAILPQSNTEQEPEVSTDIHDWKSNLLTSLKDFSAHFITFRSRDGNVIPLLSPKQEFYLQENMIAKLDLAIKAVYDENNAIYSTALGTASTWSRSFFNQDNTQVKQFESTLAALTKQNIHIDYPVKLESQSALSKVIEQRINTKVTSLTGEDK
ncbi:uroporphyrinogen-III C-methyltransferase [Vibrio profundum]|uniref:uroporphyrinogen-III C-methyltransferase n=1 Tax=Vibrio profundum TaxID=2910247 RepID=UPI003D14F745